MIRRATAVAALLSALSILSCSSSFDSASKIKALRVLAVQKDRPYARPGETVHLKMLLDDPRSVFELDAGRDAGKRHISVRWVSGCFNPDGDAFQDCLKEFTDGRAQIGSLPDTLDYSFQMPVRNLVHGADAGPFLHSAANPQQPPNGSAFVFFAVCAGNLTFPGTNGPFACTSESGHELGADDFVVGYTEILVYDKLRNANPVVPDDSPKASFQIDGKNVAVDCVGDACVALEQEEFHIGTRPASPTPMLADAGRLHDGGLPLLDAAMTGGEAGTSMFVDAGAPPFDGGPRSRDAGVRLPTDAGVLLDAGTTVPSTTPPTCTGGDLRCFPACDNSDQNKCEKHTVNLVVAESSAEPDAVANALGGKATEQMWINYYTDAGKLEHDVKLLNDATTGWNPNHAADLRVPQQVGTFHVWAVAHDNRGGAEWARVTLATTSPYAVVP